MPRLSGRGSLLIMTGKVLWTPLQPLRNVLVIVAEWAKVIGNFPSPDEKDPEKT
jgi:hypothetical protein